MCFWESTPLSPLRLAHTCFQHSNVFLQNILFKGVVWHWQPISSLRRQEVQNGFWRETIYKTWLGRIASVNAWYENSTIFVGFIRVTVLCSISTPQKKNLSATIVISGGFVTGRYLVGRANINHATSIITGAPRILGMVYGNAHWLLMSKNNIV